MIVAAATYNRPAGLRRLLDELERLTFTGSEPDVSVLIVDNSPEGSARPTVEDRAPRYRWTLLYAQERERGIAQVRNCALEAATKRGARWLAFIDDDEYPDPAWLQRMGEVAAAAKAHVVVGAVLPDYEAPPPDWLRNGGFLFLDEAADGQVITAGITGNVLFDLNFVNCGRVRFDHSFALSGGEDRLFFDELNRLGARMVGCTTGVVYETIVPARVKLRWHMRRWVRFGNTDARISFRQAPGLGTRLLLGLGGGLARIAVGAAGAVLTGPLAAAGRGHIPAGQLKTACRGWGFARAALGSIVQEYRTHDR